MFTKDELQQVENYLAKTGISLNFIADNGLIDFIKTKQPIVTENNARHKAYQGQKRDRRKDLYIGDRADALLTINCSSYKVSRSNLGAQAVLFYIKQKEGKQND